MAPDRNSIISWKAFDRLDEAVALIDHMRARSSCCAKVWRLALDQCREALRAANRDGDARAKRTALRFMNWLRADLRQMERA
jgi:hypothetical protein